MILKYGGRIKESCGNGMTYLIHCKNFCKCYNVFPTQPTKKKKIPQKNGSIASNTYNVKEKV
jgi:hypothetical protein